MDHVLIDGSLAASHQLSLAAHGAAGPLAHHLADPSTFWVVAATTCIAMLACARRALLPAL